jgi:ADP-heptose:LPS heptosyltransferase
LDRLVRLFGDSKAAVKPKLLVLELWGIGDLAIATPFLQAASEEFEVTLLAKPFALELKSHFWPKVEVLAFTAPWTRFRGKYRLHTWPWKELNRLRRSLRKGKFDWAVSARWDPRDHLLLGISAAKQRLGFPRLGSQMLLTESLQKPPPISHRYENWRSLAAALNVHLSERPQFHRATNGIGRTIMLHSGAAQPVRVWPLDRFRAVAARLRESGYPVQILCDPNQKDWWLKQGELGVVAPGSLIELLGFLNQAAALIGNDSGPGHLAAISGVPTLTVFGPQLPEWFLPLHPAAEAVNGKPCPYKPCFDSCHFPTPGCILGIHEDEVWLKTKAFAQKHWPIGPSSK